MEVWVWDLVDGDGVELAGGSGEGVFAEGYGEGDDIHVGEPDGFDGLGLGGGGEFGDDIGGRDEVIDDDGDVVHVRSALQDEQTTSSVPLMVMKCSPGLPQRTQDSSEGRGFQRGLSSR